MIAAFCNVHASHQLKVHISSKSKAEKSLQLRNRVNELRSCTFSINYISFSTFQNGTRSTSLPLANGFPYATRFLPMHHQQNQEKSTSDQMKRTFFTYITQHQSSFSTAELKQSGNVKIDSSKCSENIRGTHI